MMRFREVFLSRVAALKAIPQIAVTHCWLGEPATDGEIARVEATMGPLPDDVRALYRQANGAQLRWIDRKNDAFTDDDESPMKTAYDWHIEGDDPSADGVIHFVPVADLDADHNDDGDGVRAFDKFGGSSGCVALVVDADRHLTTQLTIGSDANASFDACALSFAAYVAAVVDSWGHRARRWDLMVGRAKPGWTIPLR